MTAQPHRRTRIPGLIEPKVSPGIAGIDSLVLWMKVSDLGLADNAAASSTFVPRVGTTWTKTGTITNKTNIIGGKPVFRITGGDEYYSFSSITVRTAFVVGHNTTGDYRFFFGDSTNWHGNPTNWGDGTWGNANWFNAATYRDGASQGPAHSVARGSTNYIWSFELAGALTATHFCKGNVSGRNWVGDYAEVLAFSDLLTDGDWNSVMSHLGNEYGYSVTLK